MWPWVKTYGFQYYPNRAALDRQVPSLGDHLNGAKSLDAIWVVGTRFFDAGKNTHIVRRLILPNPESDSAKYYFTSIDQHHVRGMIEKMSAKAQKVGTKVRWTDQFLFHAITLVDTDDPMGWVYVESVLPHAKTEQRSGYTIYKHRSEQAVRDLVEIFKDIWDDSKDAPDVNTH